MSIPANSLDPEIKPENIVDNVNDKTPDPETDIAEGAPEPPRPDREGMEQAGDGVAALADRVTLLEQGAEKASGLLETLVEKITEKTDETVEKVAEELPWTHRLGRRK